MTIEQLEAIRALCKAAANPKLTAGPWEVKRRWSNDCEIIPRITCASDADRGCGWIADMIGAPYLGHESTLPNSDFIAASRTGVPALLAALEEYGGHKRQCKASQPPTIYWDGTPAQCDCGWKDVQALREEER